MGLNTKSDKNQENSKKKLIDAKADDGDGLTDKKADDDKKQKDNFRIFSALALVTQLGFIIGITTVGGVFLGNWIDKKTGAPGLFVIFGALLGLTLGLLAGYRLIRRALK